MADPLAPFFLGAWGENNDVLEKVLVELLRDHVYWRRNFHPDDAPPITTAAQYQPAFHDGVATLKRELHRLAAQLKRSVPTFHPRYLGHMMSDLLLPGLIAELVTILYNPNNVVEEVAPVTLHLEYEVGQQLCRMMGYATDGARVPCATGHLTSGGTLANDEALWLARAVKLFPLAVKAACQETDEWPDATLRQADDWTLLGWPPARCLELATQVAAHPQLVEAVRRARVETLGHARFALAHPDAAQLTVLAPATAHYSWVKAMKLLGLGAAQLKLVPTANGHLDVAALGEALQDCEREGLPVLAVVGVFGTTEFGTFDSLHDIQALRASGPRSFWFHVDAAWGGYIPSLFRQPDGALRPREEVAFEFRHFPSERVYQATAALAEADSITVDPHKLGYVPYGAGAFLARDRRAFDLVMQDAAYLFTDTAEAERRYQNAGRFNLEGSRPGAAAAAVAINHRVLPLDHLRFGRLIARSIHACEAFSDALPPLRAALDGLAHLAAPIDPDCNLVCLAFNPWGNTSLAAANAFTRKLYEALAVHTQQVSDVRASDFFGSCTTVSLSLLKAEERRRLGERLRLDLRSADDTGVFLLRHTLMNPWLLASPDGAGGTYVDAYLHHLERLVRRTLAG